MPILFGLGIFVALLLIRGIRVLREYERGVVFRLGRLEKTRAPGIRFIIPFLDRMRLLFLKT